MSLHGCHCAAALKTVTILDCAWVIFSIMVPFLVILHCCNSDHVLYGLIGHSLLFSKDQVFTDPWTALHGVRSGMRWQASAALPPHLTSALWTSGRTGSAGLNSFVSPLGCPQKGERSRWVRSFTVWMRMRRRRCDPPGLRPTRRSTIRLWWTSLMPSLRYDETWSLSWTNSIVAFRRRMKLLSSLYSASTTWPRLVITGTWRRKWSVTAVSLAFVIMSCQNAPNRRRPYSGKGKDGCSLACSSAGTTAGVERSCQRDSPAGITTYKEDRPSGSQSRLLKFLLW